MKFFRNLRALWQELLREYTVGIPAKVEPSENKIEITAFEMYVPVPTQKLEANCVVTPRPEMNERMGVWQTPSMSLVSQCKYGKKLWVYNVSRVDHKFGHPMLGKVTIPANTTRKRYSMWTSFPEVVMGTNYNIDTDEMYTYPIAGEYFVNDLINPDNVLGCKTIRS